MTTKKILLAVFVIVLFAAGLYLVKGHYDREAKILSDYEKDNAKLKLLADRLELQYKIATYRSKMNIKTADEAGPKPQSRRPEKNENRRP